MTQDPGAQTPPASRQPAPAPAPAPAPVHPWWRRLLRRVVRILLTVALVLAGLWAALALMLADLDGKSPRIAAPALFALAFTCALVRLKPRLVARPAAALLVVVVAAWYLRISPSNDRAWAPQHAKLATATIDGDRITLHNYRALERGADGAWRERYVDQTFDLSELRRADLIMSYWGPERIAHALVSFEFNDGRCASASIEVRRRASQQGFDMIRSLFRNFELIYVVGDERALIGPGILDDHHRIYVYRTTMSTPRARALFQSYARRLNGLASQPEWYNAITDNCTTGIYLHLRRIPPTVPFSLTILVNGYLPEYAYEQGTLDTSVPFEELRRRCDIKQVGRAAYASPEFSRRIREGIPAPVQAGPE